jgi:hypothetical protein
MSKRDREEREEYVLTYFGINGKGTSIALALAHSGLKFKVTFPDDWATLKPTTNWGHLPLLNVPDGTMIGHEFAILNYIGHVVPAMAGATNADVAASQQVSCDQPPACAHRLQLLCDPHCAVRVRAAHVASGGHLPEAHQVPEYHHEEGKGVCRRARKPVGGHREHAA